MTEIELLEEQPLTMAEVREKLNHIKKEKELGFRSNKTLEYVNVFGKKDAKEAQETKEKIRALNIARLKEKHIAKIVDIAPKEPETLKAALASEEITLKQEEVQKILECVK